MRARGKGKVVSEMESGWGYHTSNVLLRKQCHGIGHRLQRPHQQLHPSAVIVKSNEINAQDKHKRRPRVTHLAAIE